MVRLHTIPQISRSSRSGIWGLYGCTWVDTIRSFPLSYEDDKNNHGYKRKTYFGWQFHKRAQESRSGFRESDSETGGLGADSYTKSKYKSKEPLRRWGVEASFRQIWVPRVGSTLLAHFGIYPIRL